MAQNMRRDPRGGVSGQGSKQTLVIVLAVIAVALAVASAVKFLRGPEMVVVGTLPMSGKGEMMESAPPTDPVAQSMQTGEGAGAAAGREGEMGGGGKPR